MPADKVTQGVRIIQIWGLNLLSPAILAKFGVTSLILNSLNLDGTKTMETLSDGSKVSIVIFIEYYSDLMKKDSNSKYWFISEHSIDCKTSILVIWNNNISVTNCGILHWPTKWTFHITTEAFWKQHLGRKLAYNIVRRHSRKESERVLPWFFPWRVSVKLIKGHAPNYTKLCSSLSDSYSLNVLLPWTKCLEEPKSKLKQSHPGNR